MSNFRYLALLIAGIAPIASIASFIGSFFGLGGWGWLLFMWFGFTGMFAMSTAEHFKPEELREKGALVPVAITLLLAIAFVLGALFALSDLPKRISIFYAILAPIPLIALIAFLKQPNQKSKESAALKEFEQEIRSWPTEQAQMALLLIKAIFKGDKEVMDKLYPELTVNQFKAVTAVVKRMEKGG